MRGRIRPKNLRQQVEIEKKRRNIVFFTSIILAMLYIGVTMLAGDMGIIKYIELKKTKSRLVSEIKALTQENKTLKNQITALKEDPYYIEKYAREEFGMARPDEYIFQFQDEKSR